MKNRNSQNDSVMRMGTWRLFFLILLMSVITVAVIPSTEALLFHGNDSHAALAAGGSSKASWHVQEKNGHIHIVGKNGKSAKGWVLIGKNVYYAKKGGKAVVSDSYSGIQFDAQGKAEPSVSTSLMRKCLKILKKKSGLSKRKKLSYAWSYMSRFHYSSHYPDLGSSGWQRSTALHALNSNGGNCYGYACAFAALAWAAGYKPYVVAGRIPGSRDGAGDGYTRHCWVRINGGYYDPELNYANHIRFRYFGSGSYMAHQVQQTVSF